MLTELTQATVAVLNDIACREVSSRWTQYTLSPDVLAEVLAKLEAYGLICLLPGKPAQEVFSYELARPKEKITLLDVLEATGEQLNCNDEASEEMYLQYGTVARKLGVVNRMTRLYLSEIKLTDL